MVIKYYPAPDVKTEIDRIIWNLNLSHIAAERVICCRSRRSKAKYTVARIHALPRVWQIGLDLSTHYLIEVLAEKFDKLDDEEKTKTLIHELLHIPKSFGGGFKHHGKDVNLRKVEALYRMLEERTKKWLNSPN